MGTAGKDVYDSRELWGTGIVPVKDPPELGMGDPRDTLSSVEHTPNPKAQGAEQARQYNVDNPGCSDKPYAAIKETMGI